MNTDLLFEIERLKSETWEEIKCVAETRNGAALDPLRGRISELEEMGRDVQRIAQRVQSLSSRPSTASGTSVGGFNGRKIRLQVTEGMINQNLLTLTQARKRGIVRRGERFTIEALPTGEKFETELMRVGNKLRERGAIARFYKAAGVEANDTVELIEAATGEWQLKLAEKAKPAFDDFNV